MQINKNLIFYLLPKKDAEQFIEVFKIQYYFDKLNFDKDKKYNLSKKNQEFFKIFLKKYDQIQINNLNQKIQKFLLVKLLKENKKDAICYIHYFHDNVIKQVSKLAHKYRDKFKLDLGMTLGFRDYIIFDYAFIKKNDNYEKLTAKSNFFKSTYLTNLIILGNEELLKKYFLETNLNKEKFELSSYEFSNIIDYLENDLFYENCLKGLKVIIPYQDHILTNDIKRKVDFYIESRDVNSKVSNKNIKIINIIKQFPKIINIVDSRKNKIRKKDILRASNESLWNSFIKKENISLKDFEKICINYNYNKDHILTNNMIKKNLRSYDYDQNHLRSAHIVEILIEKILLRIEKFKINSFVDFEELQIKNDLKIIFLLIKKITNIEYKKFLTKKINLILKNLIRNNYEIQRYIKFLMKFFKYSEYDFEEYWHRTFSKKEIDLLIKYNSVSNFELTLIDPKKYGSDFHLDQLGLLNFQKGSISQEVLYNPLNLTYSLIKLTNALKYLSQEELGTLYYNSFDQKISKNTKEEYFFKNLIKYYKKDFFKNFNFNYFTKYPTPENIPDSFKINIKNKKLKKLIFSKLNNLLYYWSISDLEKFYSIYGFELTYYLLKNDHYKNLSCKKNIKEKILFRNTLKRPEFDQYKLISSHDNDITNTKKYLKDNNISFRSNYLKDEQLIDYHTYILKVKADNTEVIMNYPFYKKEDPILFKEVSLLNSDQMILIKSPRELKDLSDYMNNCLMGYVDKIKRKESIIYTLKRNNKPFLAIEIFKNKLHEVEYRKRSIYESNHANLEDIKYVKSILNLISVV